jgi:hypothetical protein
MLAASAACAKAQELPDAPGATASTLAPSDGPDGQGQSSSSSQASPLPSQADSQTGETPAEGKQTKRILGIVPNFRSVSVNEKLPPMSVKQKFIEASQDNFDYSSIFLPAVLAFEQYETGATPEFGTGGVGYGRYLWHSVLDQTSENYWVEFIVPAVTKEDPRYYTLGKGGFKKRTLYSVSRVFVTRTDNGREQFNYGEVLGAGLASGLSNAYYPARERSFSKTADQWGTNVGIDAFTFFFKEFWPNINNALFHGKE